MKTFIFNASSKIRNNLRWAYLYLTEKEFRFWEKIRMELKECLEQYHMYAACIIGEADIRIFDRVAYSYVHKLAKKLDFSPEVEEPRLLAVVGPMINVDKQTGHSILIELWKNKLLSLYYSPYRQAIHFRLGNWQHNKFYKSKAESEIDGHVFRGSPHYPRQSAISREKYGISGDSKSNPKLVKECFGYLEELLEKDSGLVKIKEESDLSNFLFLTSDNIDSITQKVLQDFGEKAFSKDNEHRLNKDYFCQIIKKLDIKINPTYFNEISYQKAKERNVSFQRGIPSENLLEFIPKAKADEIDFKDFIKQKREVTLNSLHFINKVRGTELPKYRGNWIIIADRKIISFDKNRADAIRIALDNGYTPLQIISYYVGDDSSESLEIL